MSNLDLWNRVEKTDPAHTKRVNQRGGFTAIDAYYQIQNATAEFGPVGKGWGWQVRDTAVHEGAFIVTVTFWWENHDQCFQVLGAAMLRSGERTDSDAPKKALTDAITKALSYLGFNSDIFLGRFDDSKYVEQRREEVAAAAEGRPTRGQLLVQFQADVANSTTPDELAKTYEAVKQRQSELGDDNYKVLIQLIRTRKTTMENTSAAPHESQQP